jgi:uncharacterized repeat protein (TIGR03803 family)
MRSRILMRAACSVLLLGSLSSLAACGGGSATSVSSASSSSGTQAVATYEIGGYVTGLSTGASLTLTLQAGTQQSTLSAGNGGFQFATAVPGGTSYTVTAGTAPTGETCTVANGSSSVSAADVTDIAVSCAAITYTIGGSLTGLYSGSGAAVVLSNGSDTLTLTQNGSFTFGVPEASGSAYYVAVSGQPPLPQRCRVAQGRGTVSGANVTTVTVSCSSDISETLLSTFQTNPSGGLVTDSAGNLYGATSQGGGSVYELAPNASGSYTQPGLWSGFSGSNGQYPIGQLIIDGQGDLFGTTQSGGDANGDGTVFELLPNGSGGYTESVIYSFAGGTSDGSTPEAGLLVDSQGDLFGTTERGGDANGDGTVFELTPNGGGYTESVIYSFAGGTADGAKPYAALISDSRGDLFGTTSSGGTGGNGVVFELIPGGGGYSEVVLHSFSGGTSDGASPFDRVLADSQGNLYGTTSSGGARGYGVVFELTPGAGGYTESVLYSFLGDAIGANPYAGLIADAQGDLFGTTQFKGSWGYGTVFELIPDGSGGYIALSLHSFAGGTADGANPVGELIFDDQGNLYGATSAGGPYAGTVFEIQ